MRSLMCAEKGMSAGVEVRPISRADLSLVAEIDRTEDIGALYVQIGAELTLRRGKWSAPAWDPTGDHEHSVLGQVDTLEQYVDAGGIAVGAFAGRSLIGIGVVVPHVREEIAQLAFLHVSAPWRATGVGSRLLEALVKIARGAGDSEMVVSATPTENTVAFYIRHGFISDAEPLPELFQREPDDVHMRREL
jgi:GNAT superfamily N-acetyltransferase